MTRPRLQDVQEFSRLWGGFRASRVILTANNLGLFERIAGGTTASRLSTALRTDERATEILLDALTALGLLRKTRGVYRLLPVAKRFLLPESPWYQGDMLRHGDALWKSWSGLDEVVRTGRPNRTGGRDHEVFLKAMHNNAVLRAPAVIDAIGTRGVRTALDLGGGPGTYSIELAKRGVAVTLFDHPDSAGIARRTISRSGVRSIAFRGGDFHFDDLGGPYDLALLSQILHSNGPMENQALIGRVAGALGPKGRIAVHEFTLAADHASPPPGALFSVNMLVNTPGGRSYAAVEIKTWMKKAGCRSIKTVLLGETTVVIGRK